MKLDFKKKKNEGKATAAFRKMKNILCNVSLPSEVTGIFMGFVESALFNSLPSEVGRKKKERIIRDEQKWIRDNQQNSEKFCGSFSDVVLSKNNENPHGQIKKHNQDIVQ